MSNLLNVKFPAGSIFIGGITPQGHLSVAPKPMIHIATKTMFIIVKKVVIVHFHVYKIT